MVDLLRFRERFDDAASLPRKGKGSKIGGRYSKFRNQCDEMADTLDAASDSPQTLVEVDSLIQRALLYEDNTLSAKRIYQAVRNVVSSAHTA